MLGMYDRFVLERGNRTVRSDSLLERGSSSVSSDSFY
jgi:hypothetical protein